ncbi:threonine--tRNA ligase [Citroniella saccharovorans]|uniref:threonine--tRNA ligase n=1 Tax=Citroniella saccharovorans TaxID=2053367 RepID=UPI00361026CB
MIKITFPDGNIKEFEKGVLLSDIAKSISEGLYRNKLGAVVNGRTMGFRERVEEDAEVRFVDFEDEEGRDIFRHTSSHLMALAVKRIFPGVKFAIGPAIKDGFYYDFDLEEKLTPEDLEKIEGEMKKIVGENPELERYEMKKDEALEYFEKLGEEFKIDLIEHLPEGETISFYKLGEFIDLCRGPHLEDLKKIKAFKLLSIAGAYWRGDENNKMLQRIYGTSFPKKKDLDEYLERLEEAEKRDHRKLGRELDLFSFHEEGPGFPFFHPNGMVLKNELLKWWRDVLVKNGYGEIETPLILNEDLWHRSGHWDHYKENMYFTKIDDKDYAIKPMNCPGSTLVYSSSPHSYRDLPIRLSEFGKVHRHELSGTLHGLFRVRTFTQDDAHVYCLEDQVEDEVFRMIDLADYLYSTFGFKYTVELSTRPEDYMGDLETWEKAEESLKKALEKKGIEYRINEGDGAFYGPKIDFHLMDAIGRDWQCGTIQLDFQMPINFDLTYIDKDGEKNRPVMLHRALLGSVERFLGILIEHFAGKFPTWLNPVQVKILPISDKFNDYAEKIKKAYEEKGIRVEVDDRAEKIGLKIRQAQLNKIPYSLIVGEKEEANEEVSIRKRDEGEKGQKNYLEFMNELLKEIEEKR